MHAFKLDLVKGNHFKYDAVSSLFVLSLESSSNGIKLKTEIEIIYDHEWDWKFE